MYSSSSSQSFFETYVKDLFTVPENYTFLKILVRGGYGMVIKCAKQGTSQNVAIKVSNNNRTAKWEASIMKTLMQNNLDESNIIKFEDSISVESTTSLIFELLDISLQDYLIDLRQPMQLEDIRNVIQQMATAFDVLKTLGIMHTDVKPDNIMLVDRVTQPLKVKLIDFGLSIFTSQAKQGMTLQTPLYRVPEIILGLPFTEAIDIWSLGCVMAIMVFGVMLFPAGMEYNVLRFITDLLGPSPEHLLNAGKKSLMYFNREDCDQWQLKTPEEYWMEWGGSLDFVDNRCYTCLGQGMKTLDISRKLKCDHRTVKRFVANSEHTWVRADKGTMRKVSARQIHPIKKAAAKMPLQSSKQVFEAAGASGVMRTSSVGSSRGLQLCKSLLFSHP